MATAPPSDGRRRRRSLICFEAGPGVAFVERFLRISVALLVCSLAGLAASGARAGTPPENETTTFAPALVEPAEEDLLILQMRLNRLVLADGMIAYQMGDGACIYLSDFVAAMDFPIDVNIDDGRAEGWFISEGRTFELDLGVGSVAVDGKQKPLKTADFQRHPDGR